MRNSFYGLCVACILMLACATIYAQDLVPLTESEVNALYKTTSRSWVSVHDPSVVHTTGNTYYIMGSHRSWARSTDHMVSWQWLDSNNLFGVVNASGTVVVSNYADAFSTNETRKVKALVNGTV